MPSLWSRIVYVFSWVTLSPTPDGEYGQYPLASHGASRVLDDKPALGPIFRPPSAPSWSDITCDYTAMKGYQFCSTDGDRSCWIRGQAGNISYTINTDYEKLVPKGITRKALRVVTVKPH